MKCKIVVCFLCLLAATSFAQAPPAQTAPTLSPDKKLAYREAQHKLDVIEKQQKDLGIQIQQLQTNIQSESQRLTKAYTEAKAALDKASADLMTGVDTKKWQLSDDALTLTAAPVPAAPPPTPQAKK